MTGRRTEVRRDRPAAFRHGADRAPATRGFSGNGRHPSAIRRAWPAHGRVQYFRAPASEATRGTSALTRFVISSTPTGVPSRVTM